MHKVSIRPQWTIQHAGGQVLSPRLLALLVQVHECGSLSTACQRTGSSYRHAWDLVRQGEAMFGMPLLQMERGKGSKLTALGEKLVWADRRIAARLTPALDTLASELEVEIQSVVATNPALLRVHASHGFTIEKLLDALAADHVVVERKYVGSQEAVASLHDGTCDLAGFHVPLGDFEARVLQHHMRWLDPRTSRVICLAVRRQGLMVAPGNPRKIYDMRDLVRPDVRFINRQIGSGTRILLECLLDQAGIVPARINGFEHGEYTHAAIAAYVASGMADVGLGVEPPARQFKLDFIPVASERYFLLCHEQSLAKPQMQAMLGILRRREFQDAVNQLPGYSFVESGTMIQTLRQAFPNHKLPPKRSQPGVERPGA